MKDVLQHPVSFALSELCAVLFVCSWIVFHFRLRSRGYRGTRIAALIAANLCGGGLASFAVVEFADRRALLPNADSFQWFCLSSGSFAIFSAIFMQILLVVLPAEGRHNLRGGFRNGWLYLVWSFSIIGVLGIGSLFNTLIPDSGWPRDAGSYAGILLCCLLIYFYYRIIRTFLHRAGASRSVSAVLKTDRRRPVLYLRAFRNEAQAFDYLNPTPTAINPKFAVGGKLSLDYYLSGTVERLIGPFIALGNPNDVFAPAGAARAYVGDSAWHDEFDNLAAKSVAIVVAPGSAGELTWELKQILATGNAGKLHLLFGRYVYNDLRGNALDRWLKISPEPFDWSGFYRILSSLGFTIARESPPPGTVVSFDAMGRTARVTYRCTTPEDYVRAISAGIR